MQKVTLDLKVQMNHGETADQAMARTVTSPECLSASVLTICQNINQARITEMVAELRQQSAAICGFHGHPATHSMSIWPPIPR